jgi:glycosidase
MHWNFRYANDAYNVAKNNDQVYNDASYNVVYVDSHDYGPDGIESVRYNEGTTAWKENMSLMFTFRGVPCIYYGSEVEFMKGMKIDQYQNLSNSGRAYYGEYLSGSVTATGFGQYTASGTVKDTLNSTLSQHLMMLNKIRQKVPALSMGQYSAKDNMAFVRRYTKGNIDSLAVVAISSGSTFTGLPQGTYVDLVTGDRKTITNGTLNVSISGKGNLAVYVLENSYTGRLEKIG